MLYVVHIWWILISMLEHSLICILSWFTWNWSISLCESMNSVTHISILIGWWAKRWRLTMMLVWNWIISISHTVGFFGPGSFANNLFCFLFYTFCILHAPVLTQIIILHLRWTNNAKHMVKGSTNPSRYIGMWRNLVLLLNSLGFGWKEPGMTGGKRVFQK
jgi:hypothetical protein